MSGVRRAVVIGIDKYKHGVRTNKYTNKEEVIIKDLQGATKDADEICKILKCDGDFIIEPTKHYLTNEKATADAIRVAISDIFYDTTKEETIDIALFYFSGHGKRDYVGNGWLLPHDFIPGAPFVNGIRIQELKELFLNSNPGIKAGILILDCCYSGIAATGDRSPGDGPKGKSFDEEIELTSTGNGRYILASARADEQAREKEQTHGSNGEKHVHGLYSFHLIEGLKGDSSTCDDFGYINLSRLMDYLTEKMGGRDAPHKPLFRGFGDGIGGGIVIARRAEKVKQELEKRYKIMDDLLKSPSPQSLVTAFDVWKQIGERGAKERQDEYCVKIENAFGDLAQKMCIWWTENFNTIMMNTGNTNSYKLCDKIITLMNFNTIYSMKISERGLLLLVMGAILKGLGENPVPEADEDPVVLIAKYIGMLPREARDASALANPSSRATPAIRDGF